MHFLNTEGEYHKSLDSTLVVLEYTDLFNSFSSKNLILYPLRGEFIMVKMHKT